ncbi:MAG TPA: serine/threonine-protein kinase, partial [Candidatus Nanoarchaeia archaeon]|nr:serine/threonine-protein kinase [Candidatus Nanoarchaeia archaeon]
EASVLEQLSDPGHPGVPKFIDRLDREDGQYLVLEYVDGQNLQTLVDEERCLTPQEGVHVALQALDILNYLHSRNVIHRDLKPSNMVLGKDGRLRLIDYSTVGGKMVYPADGSTIVENYSGYMPPDFLNGKLDSKSDVYSLGATLFYAMTGTRPIDALTKKGRLDVSRLKAPRHLRRILKSMTQPDLEKRLDVEGTVRELLKMGDLPDDGALELLSDESPSYLSFLGQRLYKKIIVKGGSLFGGEVIYVLGYHANPSFWKRMVIPYDGRECHFHSQYSTEHTHVLGKLHQLAFGTPPEPAGHGNNIFHSLDHIHTVTGGLSFAGCYIALAALVNPAFLLIPVATNLGSYIFEQALDVKKEHQKLLEEKKVQAVRTNGRPVEIPLVKIDDSYREELERRVKATR